MAMPDGADFGLRPYQQAAVDGARDQLRSHRSTLIVMPTGTGKTRVFSEMIATATSRGVRSLVLVHRDELVRQTVSALQRVGCDAEVEKADERASRYGMFGAVPVVATVQTLKGRRLELWPKDAFGLVIVDEAHHATAKTYRDILDYFGTAKIVGVTATPDRSDKTGLHNVFDSVAFRYEIQEAISDGWLCPIVQRTIECDDLDLSQVKSRKGDLADGELQTAMTVDRVLHQVASPLVDQAGDRQTLVFTAGVDHAHALAAVLAGYVGAEKVDAIDGTTPIDTRREILERYRDGRTQFLLNCAVLTEGFDAPNTQCVAMARPTKSRSLYAQVLGRGLRIHPGKEDCLALDFSGNAGKHALVAPIDVLAGEDLEDDIKEAALAMQGDGVRLDVAIEKAKKEKQQRLERERHQRHVQATVAYRADSVDPFTAAVGVEVGGSAGGPAPSEKQLAFLQKQGIDGDRYSKRQASKIIKHLLDRRSKDLCTYKQARALSKHGLRSDLTFTDARRAMDALTAARWRVTPQILEEFGR